VKDILLSVLISTVVHAAAAVVLAGLSVAPPASRDIDVITLDVAKVEFSAADGKLPEKGAEASGGAASEVVEMPPEPADGALEGEFHESVPDDFGPRPVEAAPAAVMPAVEPAVKRSADDYAGIDAPPKPVMPIKPVYPALSRAKGEEGTVVVEFTVDGDGSVKKIGIAESSGYPRLDAAAVKAVASAKFSPAVRDGQPVSSVARIPLVFRLRQRK
jgi:protein TonB